MNTEFKNGYLLGLASGGVVEVVDESKYHSLIALINEGLRLNPTNGAYIFQKTSVKDLTLFDFSKTSYFNKVFSSCTLLEKAVVNTNSAITMSTMFANCTALTDVEMSSTSNVTNFDGIFQYCSKLKNVSKLDFGKATSGTALRFVFHNCTALENISFAENSIKLSIQIPSAKLTANSIQSVIDGLATVTTAQTLTLNSAIALTDEQKATINAKGWTLAQ